MHGPWRGPGILAAHVVLALGVGWWFYEMGETLPGFVLPHLPIVAFLAVVFGQACVLGFWTAFSGWPLWVRVLGLVLGVVALDLLVTAETGPGNEIFLPIVPVASVVIAAVMGVVKRRRADLVWLPPDARTAAPEPLRFSIGRLMLFTAVVAVPVGLARNAREAFGHVPPNVATTCVWSLGFVVLAVASAWAALGIPQSGWRILAVLLTSAALGGLFAYGVEEDHDWEDIANFVILNLLQTAIVLGTFLALRLMGYRLVGRSKERVEPAQALAEEAEAFTPPSPPR